MTRSGGEQKMMRMSEQKMIVAAGVVDGDN
jgi:phage shock protein PspC (stress-responsive transcriptional regulator)